MTDKTDELRHAREKADALETVCRYTMKRHYEEICLADLHTGQTRPLLDDVRSGLFLDACASGFAAGVESLIREKAFEVGVSDEEGNLHIDMSPIFPPKAV